ncbi:uncharacterized protein LOC110932973 [Helianthus annuus]|uniref:uncharacterized protein LOC110932973 n=1 Tax=Helianthus annuus TaxID=4232 RepID=UPI000B902972|nr:uncharacterized protein LOC110932973 [Helianthus annuus]
MEPYGNTRNLINGLSLGDFAIVIVDCSLDFKSTYTTRDFLEPCSLARAFGFKELICCWNKMDLLRYSEEHFKKLRNKAVRYFGDLGFKVINIRFVLISALRGESITGRRTPCLSSWSTKVEAIRLNGREVAKVTIGERVELVVKASRHPVKEVLAFTAEILVVDPTSNFTEGAEQYICTVHEPEFRVVLSSIENSLNRKTGRGNRHSSNILKPGDLGIVYFAVLEEAVIEKGCNYPSMGRVITDVETELVELCPKPAKTGSSSSSGSVSFSRACVIMVEDGKVQIEKFDGKKFGWWKMQIEALLCQKDIDVVLEDMGSYSGRRCQKKKFSWIIG